MGCCLSTSRNDDRSPYHSAVVSTASPDSRILSAQEPNLAATPNVTQASTAALLEEGRNAHHRAYLRTAAASGNIAAKKATSKKLKPAPAPKNVEAPMVSTPDGEPRPAANLHMLEKARSEFYETRVTGRKEMWSMVQIVCGLVEAGSLEDAQAILEAAGASCPTGILWGNKGGCYDDRGERYVVPAWCVGQPEGISADPGTHDAGRGAIEKGVHGDHNLSDDIAGSYTREAKGKGKIVPEQGAINGKEVTVKIRYSHTARDDIFVIGDQDRIELLAQRAREKATIPFDTKVRFVHLGRLMDHRLPLSESTWHDGQVLSLFVFE